MKPVAVVLIYSDGPQSYSFRVEAAGLDRTTPDAGAEPWSTVDGGLHHVARNILAPHLKLSDVLPDV